MYTLLTQDFCNSLASGFICDLQYQNARFYYFLGKIQPWNDTDTLDADLSYTDNAQTNKGIRSEICFMKQITPNDASLVVPRNEWTEGLVYVQWDSTQNMKDQKFYVVNSNNHVYKCLHNGGYWDSTAGAWVPGRPSLTEPDGISINPIVITETDPDTSEEYDYIWKYMYTISSFKNTRFTTGEYMPVQKSLGESFYNNGKVESVTVIDPGSGYTDELTTTIVVNDSNVTSGTDAAADVTITDGKITSIDLTNVGSGYIYTVDQSEVAVKVIIDSGTVTPLIEASATAVIAEDGTIESVTVDNEGLGYDEEQTTITFQVGTATLVPVINALGEIVDVTIEDGGAGYTDPPALTVSGDGQGVFGNVDAQLECSVYKGEIVSVFIKDHGENYIVDGKTTITVTGDGTGGAFTPVIVNGKIDRVIVDDPGSGYTNAVLTVVGEDQLESGTQAYLKAIITPYDATSNQSIIEQTAKVGAIYTIVMTNPGSGYNVGETTVNVVGNGTSDVVATPVIDATTGGIIAVEISDYGEGFSYADIEFVNETRSGATLTYVDATAYAVICPCYGHGANAPVELFADTVLINSSMRNEMEDYGLEFNEQEFRMFGIIKNPRNIYSNKIYTVPSTLCAYKVTTETSTLNLALDDIMISPTLNRFRVLQIESGHLYLVPLDKDYVAPLGQLTEEKTGAQYYVNRVEEAVEVDKYSGQLLYFSADYPFSFSTEQNITLKTFIKF